MCFLQFSWDLPYKRLQNIIDIFFASAFYDKLIRENKDVAYYGDKITVQDSDKELMRWKISEDEYRVIYGDLTAETISTEQSTELEATIYK